MSDPAAFFANVAPDAQLAAERTGVPASVILAQWGVETGYGTSHAWLAGNNYAGVSAGGHPVTYADRAAGLAAYISTLLSPRYATVRAAADPTAAAAALSASPWDAGHYGGTGQELVDAIGRYGLDRYDVPTGAGSSTPAATNVGLFSGVTDGARRIALEVVFVLGGIALLVAGAWTATGPAVKRAAAKVGDVAGDAAKVAAL